MKLLLDILQGLGVASATGLRPFLPAILTGALATADLGVDFDGTSFAFLESPIWLLILVVALVASIFVRKLLESPPGEAALSGIGIGLGALLCAGSIDDRHSTWWYGLIAGAAVALLASTVTPLPVRARARALRGARRRERRRRAAVLRRDRRRGRRRRSASCSRRWRSWRSAS